MKFPSLSLFVSSATTVAMIAAGTSAQTLVRSVTGPAANAQYGKACIRIADQNVDGFSDLLIGAPGFNSQRGAIYCVSGAHLALGGGTVTLWSVAPTANQGDLFGTALAEIPDMTGDGVKDFVVGQPGYDAATMNDVGAVRLVNGATHVVGPPNYGGTQGASLGSAIETFGASQIVVAAPGPLASTNRVLVASVAQLITSGVLAGTPVYAASGGIEFGASIAAGADLNGDGLPDIVIGAPGYGGQAGLIWIYSPGVPTLSVTFASVIAGERFGASVDARHDYDGDGLADIVVGAPKSPNGTPYELGRAVVLSGAKLIAQTPPYEIHTFTTTPGFAGSSHFHFGAAVRASGDLNGDGIGEILVGAPDYFSNQFTGPGRGFVQVFSGATGAPLAKINGANNEHLGDSLTGAFQDLEGDGFKEFVVAGSLSDTGAPDSGIVKCYRLFPTGPSLYCVGKLNSLGCTPSISWSGSPTLNSAAPFLITASNVISQKSGLLFYAHAPLSFVFQGGLKCVASPTVRTPQQNSGGSISGADCTGTFSFDFNAWISGHTDPTLVAGAEVFAQYWSRDPQSNSTTSLSNALRFMINP